MIHGSLNEHYFEHSRFILSMIENMGIFILFGLVLLNYIFYFILIKLNIYIYKRRENSVPPSFRYFVFCNRDALSSLSSRKEVSFHRINNIILFIFINVNVILLLFIGIFSFRLNGHNKFGVT